VGAVVPAPAGSQSFLDELDFNSVPPDMRKEGSDWFAVFNPKVKRQLDVTLVHTLMHERFVLILGICNQTDSHCP
jgi:glucose repression regulatory protein TUP1